MGTSDYLATLAILISIVSALVAISANEEAKRQWEESRKEVVRCIITPIEPRSFRIWRRGRRYGTTLSYSCILINNSDRKVVIERILVDPVPDTIMGGMKTGIYNPRPMTPDERNDPPLPLILEPSETKGFTHYQEFEIDNTIGSILLGDDDAPMRFANERDVSHDQLRSRVYNENTDLLGNPGSTIQDDYAPLLDLPIKFSPSELRCNPRFSITVVTARGNRFTYEHSFYNNHSIGNQ